MAFHEALKPLQWLKGTWTCEKTKGFYPTISDFFYGEELEFISIGQPMLNFSSRSWHAEKKNPMHRESGFLRIKPGTNQVSFIVAHNFGVTSIEEGEVKDNKLELVSKDISRISFAKQPSVTKIVRTLKLEDNGELVQTLFMETTKTTLSQHLEARYVKKS